jgi:hypothetical protein
VACAGRRLDCCCCYCRDGGGDIGLVWRQTRRSIDPLANHNRVLKVQAYLVKSYQVELDMGPHHQPCASLSPPGAHHSPIGFRAPCIAFTSIFNSPKLHYPYWGHAYVKRKTQVCEEDARQTMSGHSWVCFIKPIRGYPWMKTSFASITHNPRSISKFGTFLPGQPW